MINSDAKCKHWKRANYTSIFISNIIFIGVPVTKSHKFLGLP